MTRAAPAIQLAATRATLLCLVLTGAPAAAVATPPAGRADRVEYRDPATPPTRGPSDALVTIEVFIVPGPNMPTAKLRLLHELQERHPRRSRLVYRIVKSGAAVLAPSAALAAHAEGKFFELMDELGKQRSALTRDGLLELATRVGLDPERVALAPRVDRYREVLEANQRRFERLHAGIMPSVVLNARPTRTSLAAITATELDDEYEAAYERALDKLDRGFAPGALAAAFEDDAMAGTAPRRIGDDNHRAPRAAPPLQLDGALATPPLQLGGLPSFGEPGVTAAIPIVVLCRPNDLACNNLLQVVEHEARLYPEAVRIVWAPWFDVGREDAADLTLLGDAALCAEQIGSNHGELTTSPGWAWVKAMYAQSNRSHGKKLGPDSLIDAVAGKLDVDRRALSACRARIASSTLARIAAARHAGVPRCNSAIVIGGRIYDSVAVQPQIEDGRTDQSLIHQLVEAELAPGILGALPSGDPGRSRSQR